MTTTAQVRISDDGTATVRVAGRSYSLRALTTATLREKVIDKLAREAGRIGSALLVDAIDPEHGQEWFTIDSYGTVELSEAPATPPVPPRAVDTYVSTTPEPAAPATQTVAVPRPLSLSSLRNVAPAAPLAEKPIARPAAERVDVEPEFERTVVRVPKRPRRAATVEFSTGQSVDVTDAVLIGRRPVPTDALDGRPFIVEDESRTLSKTHARLYWEGGQFFAVDAGSANGIIVTVDGHEMRLSPLVPFSIEDGMTLELGDVIATFAIAPEATDGAARATRVS